MSTRTATRTNPFRFTPAANAAPALAPIAVLVGAAAVAILPFGATTVAEAQTISGFPASTYTLNGSPTIASNVLTLTDGSIFEARSAFYNTKLTYANGFTASFIYTPSGTADGVAFILQNSASGASAVGNDGGGLGYSGIAPSAAVELNILDRNTIGTAYATNGSTGTYNATGSVNVASGEPILVALSYSSSADSLTETLTDETTNATYMTTYTSTGLASTVGGTTAYVGFSGGTGLGTSTQTISNFTFSSSAAATAPEPSALMLLAPGALGVVDMIARRRRIHKAASTHNCVC